MGVGFWYHFEKRYTSVACTCYIGVRGKREWGHLCGVCVCVCVCACVCVHVCLGEGLSQ